MSVKCSGGLFSQGTWWYPVQKRAFLRKNLQLYNLNQEMLLSTVQDLQCLRDFNDEAFVVPGSNVKWAWICGMRLGFHRIATNKTCVYAVRSFGMKVGRKLGRVGRALGVVIYDWKWLIDMEGPTTSITSWKGHRRAHWVPYSTDKTEILLLEWCGCITRCTIGRSFI